MLVPEVLNILPGFFVAWTQRPLKPSALLPEPGSNSNLSMPAEMTIRPFFVSATRVANSSASLLTRISVAETMQPCVTDHFKMHHL